MKRKNKNIYIMLGIIILTAVIVVALIVKNKNLFFADDPGLNIISNTATLQYCKQGDSVAICDPVNNKFTYSINSNTTQTVVQSATPDTTPPTTSITSPSAGSTVSAIVNIVATAQDNIAVGKVEFYYDSNIKIGEDTSTPYSTSWDTSSLANGTHTIFTKAYDTSNNTGTSSTISVNIQNSTPIKVINFTSTISNRTLCPSSTGTITITPTIAPTPVAVTLQSDCKFSYTSPTAIPSGTYTITLNFNSFLKKTFTANLPSASTINAGTFTGGNFSSLGGNDCVNIYDYTALKLKWNITNPTGDNILYDLNGDGRIEGMDWGVMYDSWNQGSGCN